MNNLDIDLSALSHEELVDIAEVLKNFDEKVKYNKQAFLYTEKFKKDYPKIVKFFKAGLIHKERALIAGNRTGKTYDTSMEASFHINGRYPEDWEGKKFFEPVEWRFVGKTHESTRNILQKYIYGNYWDFGTGMIPKEDIVDRTLKSGVPNAVQDLYVKHYTNGIYDGVSHVEFKSYVQGIGAFMGDTIHGANLDEEPDDYSLYSEIVTRTMTTQGTILCSFTPLEGLSDVVLSFLPGGLFPPGGGGEVQQEQ